MLTHSVFKPFRLALSFLTRLPVPRALDFDAQDHGRSVLYYPLVGLLIGSLLLALLWLLPAAEPLLLAAVLVTLWAVITGALHLDGLADSSDAWLGGQGDTDKMHRILKDSAIGAAGAVALICVLLLKVLALGELISMQSIWVLMLAPVLGRTAAVGLLLTTPYVREQGLGSALLDKMPRQPLWAMVAMVIVVAVLVNLVAVLIAAVLLWLIRRMMIKNLGGCTGDTLGASIELTECMWLLAAALMA